ncbi:MAG: OAM dimerization domain-containing protein [Candidatus Wallbacteria bacterium]|nr:OAM dimerization domain-containing protein [Candidatus Wallbacteria bacterium]
MRIPVDLKSVRPYGDTLNDGAMQLSFTLPVPEGAKAKEAALTLLKKMGFSEASIVCQSDLGNNFTYFVAYGKTTIDVDYQNIKVVEIETRKMGMYEINDFIKSHFNRKLVVVGACTGDDAHTVGIDAIMNMKGYAGHYGLERYSEIDAYNFGSQVPNEELISRAREKNADAILVSQVVTQKDAHIKNLTQFIEIAEAEDIREQMLLIIGGPRIDHKLALELGFDAGFGPGSFADDVASFIVEKLLERKSAVKS